jgi:hypothetical protein
MLLIEIVLIAILVLWLGASVVKQVAQPRVAALLSRFDPAGLVPAWTFFAPHPGVTDYAVVYRDLTVDGEASPWRGLIETRCLRRWRWLWNPDKRVEKLVTDLVPFLARSYDPDRLGHLLEPSYLTLLAAVEAADHDCRAAATQFAVLAVTGFQSSPEAGPVFVSAAVELPQASAAA